MYVYYGDQIPLSTLRHTLLVMAFCFLPHLDISPWWLSILALGVIGYRLAGSYWSYPVPSLWIRSVLAIFALFLLRWHYGAFLSGGFFIGVLVTFFWLKVIELHRKRDLRAVILISFYVIFTALITHTNLWVFFYVILAVLANLSLLLKMQTPSAPIARLSKKSVIFILIAIPVSVLMFFVFPRITTPLWLVNLPSTGETAFQEDMSPGTISSLRPDDSTVMRITFNNKAKIDIRHYWKGLALSHYDGITWSVPTKRYDYYMPVPLLSRKEDAEYEIMLEPHEKRWLFYIQEPIAAWPKLQYSSNTGLIRLDYKEINQRFAYALISAAPEYLPLNRLLIKQNLQIPTDSNPELQSWAKQEYIKSGQDPKKFTEMITAYIQNNPFWYKLTPQPIGRDKIQLDRFWFNTREGYCEHYSSAVAFIYRSAGVPARVLLGYYGGEWNPVGKYLNVRQMDAHAWVEYWQNGIGWVRYDPTAVIPISRIDKSIQEEIDRSRAFYIDWENYQLGLSWFERASISYQSFKYFWERWLLFYNQERQQQLIKSLGFGNWGLGELIQLWVAILLLFLFSGGIWHRWRLKHQDPLIREHNRLKEELNRLKINTAPPSSLFQQMLELEQKKPNLGQAVHNFLNQYEAIRLKQQSNDTQANRHMTQSLIRTLREKLRRA